MAKQTNNAGSGLGFEAQLWATADKLRGNMEPYKGRIFDPCCSSGGMFVQSERFVEEHGGRIGDIAIYGQESNYTTWRLAKMNPAVRGIDADIRRALVEADAVDCMIALPGQLFYSTQIPACLWFLARNKNPGGDRRERRGEVLFIDARKLGRMIDRTRKEFSDDDIARISDTYRAWRGAPDAAPYEDEPGFCKSATLDEIREHSHVLTPGRYVGTEATEDDDVPFEERFAELKATLAEQFAEAEELSTLIFSWSGSLLARFWTEGEGALNQHLFKVTSDQFPSWFFSQWVHHHLEDFRAIAASKATTMGHIQRRHLKEAMTILPPDGVLTLLGQAVGPLVEHTIKNELENRTLAETRDLLLPKLMSGEIRLAEGEKALEAVA